MEPETVQQGKFFTTEEETDRLMELFPEVWRELEALADGDADTRRMGLLVLQDREAVRVSPLIAYVVTTRITDEDPAVRSLAIETSASSLRPDARGVPAPEVVRSVVRRKLHEIGRREILCLAETSANNPDREADVVLLLSCCTHAGRHLVEIASGRGIPLAVRQQAIRLVGLVGYTDALTPLERMRSRLEARVEGQKSMPFAPPASGDEQTLLPVVRRALSMLNAP